MTVDVTGPHTPILVEGSGEKEIVKSDIRMPYTVKEKPKENEVLEIAGVELEQVKQSLLDATVHERISSRIQIDKEGYLIISEAEHLATLSGTARVASGNKPALQSKAPQPEGVFHWQDKV
jgi:hypothetical protein